MLGTVAALQPPDLPHCTLRRLETVYEVRQVTSDPLFTNNNSRSYSISFPTLGNREMILFAYELHSYRYCAKMTPYLYISYWYILKSHYTIKQYHNIRIKSSYLYQN